jgi:hypothetical protein
MSYPAGHRAAVKKSIIDCARKLFNRYGFESVSLQVDRALADELRAACIAVALDLGGWNKKSKS